MAQAGLLGVAPGSGRPDDEAVPGQPRAFCVRLEVDVPAEADPRTARRALAPARVTGLLQLLDHHISNGSVESLASLEVVPPVPIG